MSASITLTRDNGYVDLVRDYRVMVDDKEVGRIGQSQTKQFAIEPGTHTVRLKIDWCGSPTLTVDAIEGETVKLECVSALRGWKMCLAIFYVTIWTKEYISLQRAA